jgi:hypothetical protein
MKKVWKWIIGIVLVLVIIAVLVGVGFLVRNNFHVNRTEVRIYRGFSQRGPEMMPYGGFGYNMRGPGMMGYGLRTFSGFIGGLFMLGFLALVVLGIIWLVRRLNTTKPVNATAATPAATPAPMPAASVNPCTKCGRPLQADWKVCPYCGKKV